WLSRCGPDSGVTIFSCGPAQTLRGEPDPFERGLFSVTEKMVGLMQEDRSPFVIVRRKLKELRVKRDYFEGKIRCCVSIAMAHVTIPPVVRAAIGHQMTQHKCV